MSNALTDLGALVNVIFAPTPSTKIGAVPTLASCVLLSLYFWFIFSILAATVKSKEGALLIGCPLGLVMDIEENRFFDLIVIS